MATRRRRPCLRAIAGLINAEGILLARYRRGEPNIFAPPRLRANKFSSLSSESVERQHRRA